MKEIILARDTRLALRSQAHHLSPVVLLGANGLTDAVIREIDRELTAHELIKVRVPTDDRQERQAIFSEVAEKLGAARVQMIGKQLIFWRPQKDEDVEKAEEAARLKILAMGRGSIAGKKQSEPVQHKNKRAFVTAEPKKKVASKKPGEKKKKAAPVVTHRAHPKRNRVTKKAALAN